MEDRSQQDLSCGNFEAHSQDSVFAHTNVRFGLWAYRVAKLSNLGDPFLPLDEAVATRAVFVIVSGSDGRTGGNAFGAS